jgi:hypothetical protein
MDIRKYNVIDLTKSYRPNSHYLTREIDPHNTSQINGLVNRLSTKNIIVNNNIQKLTEKI